MRRSSSFAGLVLALTALAASAACKEETGIKVTSFKFIGVKAVTDGQLRSVLATTPSSKLPWGDKHYFSREQFNADLKRIEAFYRDRGFPDARVSSFDVQPNKDQTAVKITVTISEGEPILVERIVFEGLDPLPEQHRRSLQTNLPLKEGKPLDRALLQASREAALDELKDHGYPYASVSVTEVPGSSDDRRVVTLHAEPGILAQFGPLDIQGNSSVSDRIIRRQLTFRPGQVYQQSKVLDSQRRLYTLELFQFASVKADTLEQAAEIPTRITVKEGKHRKVNLDLGYGSEERARAQIDWRHVNFFGGARTVGVLARYSGLDRGVKLNLLEPYIFSRNYSLNLQGQLWHSDQPQYVLDTTGGRATLTRRFGRAAGRGSAADKNAATSLSLTYVNEYESSVISPEALADPSFRDDLIALGLNPTGIGQQDAGVTKGLLSAIFLDAGRNTTGNLLDARKGYVANLHLEQAGTWLRGDYDYYEATVEGRYYVALGTRAVLAIRARGGSIDGLRAISESPVPFFKRYFLGGATNLRGWGRYEVSPLSGSGLAIGGQTTMNFSTEVRVPLVGNLGGVLFLDGGNVWVRPWDFNLNDLRYDVGSGLRYDTRIGPLRIDVGYQLNPIPGLLVDGKPESRHFRVHFSVGQAF
jgi:outer membrane protein insertion porin family/translocation and assembly module TamA